jgi:flavoprotein
VPADWEHARATIAATEPCAALRFEYCQHTCQHTCRAGVPEALVGTVDKVGKGLLRCGGRGLCQQLALLHPW